jgi:hypothetical protein
MQPLCEAQLPKISWQCKTLPRILVLRQLVLLSFPINDIQPRRGNAAAIRRDSASMSTGAGGLSGELQEYQTSSIKLKEKVTELRRQKAISPIQKQDLNAAIKELQAREIRLKNQLEY